MSTIRAYDHSPPFILLKPKHTPVRQVYAEIWNEYSRTDIDELIGHLTKSKVVAIDYETTGLNVYHEDFRAVGVGFAWDSGRVYLPNLDRKLWQYLHTKLQTLTNLIAHNVMYDGAVFFKYTKTHAKWLACTQGLYKQLANEGWFGQSWSLKRAMTDVLQWPVSNEVEIDTWLIENGYVTEGPEIRKSETEEQFRSRYQTWLNGSYLKRKCPTTGKMIDTWVVGRDIAKPNKGEMWRCPVNALGKYCMLDCEATYLLFTEHLVPTLKQFPHLDEFHSNEFLTLVMILIEQYLAGIQIDEEQLQKHLTHLNQQLIRLRTKLIEVPQVGQFVYEWENPNLIKLAAKEPPKFKVLPKEPKKVGSAAWKRWKSRCEELERNPIPNPKWEQWNAKFQKFKSGQHSKLNFNFNSTDQRAWLLYEKMFNWELIQEPQDKQRGLFGLHLPDGRVVELEMTKSGGLPTNELAMSQMGEVGKLLIEFVTITKEISTLNSYTEQIYRGKLHPNFRVPGTVTGRLSSNSPNLQQVSKTLGTMKCFIPSSENAIWIDCDIAALEQVVLADYSQDESLMGLYGPNAKANDVYLFVGAQIPGLKEAILATGYQYDDPTEETITRAKRDCKLQRSIAKVLVLASSYGAGAKKIWRTLSLSGIQISLKEVYQIHTMYHELFAGVNTYYEALKQEWTENRGWVLDKLGHPVCVHDEKLKDIGNRVIQKDGHNIHTMWVYRFVHELNKQGIEWKPVCIDWHDQSIIETSKEQAPQAKQIMLNAFVELNAELNWSVEFSGEAQIVPNLAYAKLPDEELQTDSEYSVWKTELKRIENDSDFEAAFELAEVNE